MIPHHEILASVPLFTGLTAAETEDLLSTVEIRQYAAGELLFNIDDPGGAMMIVLDGAVEFYIFDENRNRVTLSTTTQGGFFGEVSLFGDTARSANACAVQATEVAILNRDVMERFIYNHPVVAINIITMLSKRLRDSTTRVVKKEYNAYDLLQERLKQRASRPSAMPSQQA